MCVLTFSSFSSLLHAKFLSLHHSFHNCSYFLAQSHNKFSAFPNRFCSSFILFTSEFTPFIILFYLFVGFYFFVQSLMFGMKVCIFCRFDLWGVFLIYGVNGWGVDLFGRFDSWICGTGDNSFEGVDRVLLQLRGCFCDWVH